ncbi:MAG: XdhC family protein [Planctomycetes bacterium]|nr:XdhC family protein [Planctomycetota bacterium]
MRAIHAKILELIDAGRAFAVATVADSVGSVPAKRGAKMILLPDGAQFGTVGGAKLEENVKALCREALREKRGSLRQFDLMFYKEGGLDSLCGGTVKIMVEYVAPLPHLLIAGGGHCGLEVAKLCDQLGYFYSVLDDRPDYVSQSRFPNARRRILASPDEFAAKEDLSAFTHALLLGYSHKFDTDLLFHLATKHAGWIGVIASKAKRIETMHRLKARGIPEEALARVVSPVGLAIGAETPAEIAVSILGQIIADVKGPKAGEPEPVEERDSTAS